MSVLDELKAFCKTKLNKVSTKVTCEDGQSFIESASLDGTRTRQSAGTSSTGYVIDTKPDLQIVSPLEGLFIGSQDVAQDLDSLKQNKITHIINLGTGVKNYFTNEFIYKKVFLLDIPDANARELFDVLTDFIDDAIQNGGSVLVHCNAGISRSATIVIAYLMKKGKMRYSQAYALLKEKRPVIRPNEGFVQQLQDYDTELFGLIGFESNGNKPQSKL